MTPLIVGLIVLAIFVVGWFLFYTLSMRRLSSEPDNGGAFKLVMIVVTPIFLFGALVLAFYVTIGGFIIEWAQNNGILS